MDRMTFANFRIFRSDILWKPDLVPEQRNIQPVHTFFLAALESWHQDIVTFSVIRSMKNVNAKDLSGVRPFQHFLFNLVQLGQPSFIAFLKFEHNFTRAMVNVNFP